MRRQEKIGPVQRSVTALDALDADALLPLYASDCEWQFRREFNTLADDGFTGEDGLQHVTELEEPSDGWGTATPLSLETLEE